MHIETLVRMANEIGAFFASAATDATVASEIETHLRRFWDPRMRTQIIEYLNAGGEGLDERVRVAIGRLVGKPLR